MELVPSEYGFRCSDNDYYFTRSRGLDLLSIHLSYNPEGQTPEERRPVVQATVGGQMPTHLEVVVSEYASSSGRRSVPIEKLEHIRTVNGGIAYRKKSRRTPGDGVDRKSHTYGLWINHDFVRSQAVISVQHGGGIHFLLIPHFSFDETILDLQKSLNDQQFYDLLDVILTAYVHGQDHGRSETRRQWSQAFVDKRIKKRRKDGRVHVEIVPKIVTVPESVT